MDKPYGHRATIERRKKYSHDIEQVQIRRRGTRRAIERAAELTPCFIRIVEVEAYTEEQWIRVFGLPQRPRL